MVKQSKYLFAPPCSEEIETYIIPIPKHQYEVYEGLKIAGGWRYFDNLRVIQKKKGTFIEVLMSVSDFIKLARTDSKEALRKAEMSIENIVKKRPSFANIDMSLPHIMGVSNLTPDSFYKNSRNSNPDIVLRKCKEMLKNGATIIDIGGESSRPGADKISENEERQRILQTLLRLKQENVKTIISLDTRNLSTMKLGQKIGVDIINDISSLDSIEKANFIISKKLPVIIMHMQNNPENMQDNPKYSFSPIDIFKILSFGLGDLPSNNDAKLPNIQFFKTSKS